MSEICVHLFYRYAGQIEKQILHMAEPRRMANGDTRFPPREPFLQTVVFSSLIYLGLFQY